MKSMDAAPQSRELNLSKQLSALGQELHTSEELLREPIIRELMERIAKINRGIRFNVNSEDKVYTVGQPQRAWSDGTEQSYEFRFSLNDLKESEQAPVDLQYVKYEGKDPNISLVNYKGGGGNFGRGDFSVEDLLNPDSRIRFSNEGQQRFFDEVKEVISSFIEEKGGQS